MDDIYNNIIQAVTTGEKLMAVLIDPDKYRLIDIAGFIQKVDRSIATHIFVGGSEVNEGITQRIVVEIKKWTDLPIVVFPGDVTQITEEADGLLFLSLISGRNADYLIGKQIKAASKLLSTSLEIIPTGYILIENGKQTSVERVSNTLPLSRSNIQKIVHTAKAGELLGMKLIYLEAGSGATLPINKEIIKSVKAVLNIPLIVGGGIRNSTQLEYAYKAGADLVVMGTVFEENEIMLNKFKNETI